MKINNVDTSAYLEVEKQKWRFNSKEYKAISITKSYLNDSFSSEKIMFVKGMDDRKYQIVRASNDFFKSLWEFLKEFSSIFLHWWLLSDTFPQLKFFWEPTKEHASGLTQIMFGKNNNMCELFQDLSVEILWFGHMKLQHTKLKLDTILWNQEHEFCF